LSANTVAAIYRDRRQIDLFVEALKQNLKSKIFLGTSANGVHTQIWTAFIAMPLRYLQASSRFGWSLSILAALLRMKPLRIGTLWRSLISLSPLRPIRQSIRGPGSRLLDLGQHTDRGTIHEIAINPSQMPARSRSRPGRLELS
jgi:hypothetical protein